jgi:tRNA-dihydrouridine synthase
MAETGCDGVMIARGAFGFPWMFREDNYQPSVKERLTVALEHAKLFQEKLGGQKSFFIMRKHFKAYASGFEGSHELRVKLLETKSLGEAEEIVEKYLKDQ